MAETSQLIQGIESFVDSTRSPTQQAASLDVIASLLKNNQLTIETLVREMEGYLTTADNIIRARGILLLGEVLMHLASKPLDDATIHSLIQFFTDRLADWRALRGALVGCLALLRRKSSGGIVSETDAKAVAESYLQNLQVQSLGKYDRKLCFELLLCLLERYPKAIASLGDNLIYGICEAVDGEKDPHCLMLIFHIIEILPQLFPDPLGPFTSFAHDLFENLSYYFPVHFTHPKGEDVNIKRDDLARALMLAFSSTPLFEPFAIPLLIEKLSSSLPSAKVDSLRYLSDCTVKYGVDRMAKHGEALWSSLKDAVFTSLDGVLSFTPESLEGLCLPENEIAAEALSLLQKLIVQNTNFFLDLIVVDEDINMIFNMISSYKSYHGIPAQSKQRLHAVGCILSASVKASTASCNRVFECFFSRLMDILGLCVRNSSGNLSSDDSIMIPKRYNHGALYLSIELLSACRDVIASSETIIAASAHTEETWSYLLRSFSSSLTKAFCSASICTSEDSHDADVYFGVKGLLILATFPEGYLLISKPVFEKILMTFVSIVTVDYSNTLLWKLALKALVQIGSFIEKCHESEKEPSYLGLVVEKIVSFSSLGDFSIPFPLRLEALSEIGTSGKSYMLKVVEGLEEAIYANLSEVYVHGSSNSAEIVTQLLKCYSDKVIPWIQCAKGFDEVPLQFAIHIWNQIELSMVFNATQTNKIEVLDVMMKAMKLAVASCSEENQNIIVQKSYHILSSSTSFPLKELFRQESFQIVQVDNSSSRDEWILSLFAAVVIAVHPETYVPNIKPLLYLFMTTLLKGNVVTAQALGSVVNKLGLESAGVQTDCTLEEVMDIILNLSLWIFHSNSSADIQAKMTSAHDISLINLCSSIGSCTSLQIHAIVGLAWIGKGLLMRGHEKVKDITMIFLRCLQPNGRAEILHQEEGISESNNELDLHHSVMKSAADAFQILMGDSEVCLNRGFHAVIRPLYKQRFFSTMMPILQSLIMKSEPLSRPLLLRASAHIIVDTPLIVVLSDAKKIIPMLLDGLSALSNDILDKDVIYGLLLVLSGILMDKNGQEAVSDSAHTITNRLIELIQYPHMMLVRETAIQCLVAISGLSYARVYPMRTQVLQAIAKALDDPKRAVRQEAVRCRQAWASIASRSLHF
ncbi:MMS19 nucleotide excision repair protein, putative isoform 1 [Theobroma cacao]|uniref:MMS19 nucleotide excision repair protein n=1 Tax=Theobroma cacao TaxID=3641 RepID=A0A061GCP6_THECC|nr:MMS19 nucleotide excision repair protein, putative isoform 1 [Theobroma cacao]EOY26933.1 MMS19 nucleotide excision repair protein, putative isoform 1 [Theobroma cacao]